MTGKTMMKDNKLVGLDYAYERTKNIVHDVAKCVQRIKTEEDTKIQIITRLITEGLNWSLSDISAEVRHDNGYSDYLLSNDGKPVLIIEAKRIGSIEIGTAENVRLRHLKISGPGLRNAFSGIDQAAGYATSNGLPIAVLTDGLAWVIFKPFVPGENFKNKEAFVFPSLNAVLTDFHTFYELLSKELFAKKIYNLMFDKLHQNRLLLTQSLYAPLEGNKIKISQKNNLAFDLDRVFSSFFTRLIADDDGDMLINCFVETRESRIADFSLEKLTANVLGHISPVDKDVDRELANLIEAAVEVDSGQTIFIVGPTGAGKSTFLDRFFRKTLSNTLRRQCLVIRVNCLDASGREETVLQWLTESIITSLEELVYEGGTPSWGELQGLYYSEYIRRSKGVDALLYQRDRDAFKDKFSKYLDLNVENDREGYLKRILTDAVRNRMKLPILVIDNTDEFSIEYKKMIFQFVQSLRRHANHCLLIFPVTDKSAWTFSKTDIFGIYQSRSFFLPTPSPREVFRKRIDFLKDNLSGNVNEEQRSSYFASRGIRISIDDLNSFAQVLENVFVNQDYTSSLIGELTNYNIRRTLLLSKRVITSSVFKIDDLIRSFIIQEAVVTNFSKFMNSLMKGDYEAYKRGDGHEIYPVFQVDQDIRQSPLMVLRILALLDSWYKAGKSVDERHISVQSAFDYFDAVGCMESSVDRSLLALLEAGLIEPYDASVRDLSPGQRLAISFRGRAHLRLAVNNKVYLEQMALTTSIVNEDIAHQIRDTYLSNTVFYKKMDLIKDIFIRYVLEEDKNYMKIPIKHKQYECQFNLINRLERFIQNISHSGDEWGGSIEEEHQEGIVLEGVIATVDWFDAEKGFGLVEIEGVDGKVFLHSQQLQQSRINLVNDGDELLCDVRRNAKGLHIAEVHDIETDLDVVETVDCRIIRVFHDRGYGFVQIGGSSRNAFFHFSIVPSTDREKLKIGIMVKAQIKEDKSGRGLQVKTVISFLDSEGENAIAT